MANGTDKPLPGSLDINRALALVIAAILYFVLVKLQQSRAIQLDMVDLLQLEPRKSTLTVNLNLLKSISNINCHMHVYAHESKDMTFEDSDRVLDPVGPLYLSHLKFSGSCKRPI